jgi:glycerophosphoryl diester phosphodiesterase
MIEYLIIFLITLSLLYLILIMPRITNKPDVSGFMGRHYAHRGLHKGKDIPENSLTAIKLAVEHGYGIEFDIQVTKDQVPIVFHDDSLERVCGIDKNISDLNYDELKEITLYDSKEKIPHLKEVLDLVDGKVPLIIELKAGKAFDRESIICNTVSPYLDNYKGTYCIESFNPLILLWYKRNRPNIIRGQLATNKSFPNTDLINRLFNFLLRNLLFNGFTKPDFIAYNHKFSKLFTFNLCRKLYKPLTVAYTIQTQEDMDKALKIYDLIIFDEFIPE